jgi:hypothetical protein
VLIEEGGEEDARDGAAGNAAPDTARADERQADPAKTE